MRLGLAVPHAPRPLRIYLRPVPRPRRLSRPRRVLRVQRDLIRALPRLRPAIQPAIAAVPPFALAVADERARAPFFFEFALGEVQVMRVALRGGGGGSSAHFERLEAFGREFDAAVAGGVRAVEAVRGAGFVVAVL